MHLLVLQLLAALHRPHDGGVNGVAAVLVHVLDDLLLLIHHRKGDLRGAKSKAKGPLSRSAKQAQEGGNKKGDKRRPGPRGERDWKRDQGGGEAAARGSERGRRNFKGL